MLTASDLEVGGVYLERRPMGRVGLLRYEGVRQGSHLFLDVVSGAEVWAPYVGPGWLTLERRVKVPHEVRRLRGEALRA